MAQTIVIGDASLSDRGAFREALKGTGYEVVADAAHGDALAEAAEKHKPWCVAFDLLLPGHADRGGDGGVNVMKRLKQKFPALKFLAVHNVQTAQLVMGALSDGAGARVRKPFKRESLIEALAKLGSGQEGTTSVKQQAVRLRKAMTMKYKLATDGFFTKKREAVTTDVSEAGIGMTTEEKIQKTAILNVEIDLVGEAPVLAKMQVARVAPVAGLPRFDLGLVFIELDQASRERLKRYIMKELERGTVAPPKK
ncbi:MAG: response regulator [Planctomycetota bacterium]